MINKKLPSLFLFSPSSFFFFCSSPVQQLLDLARQLHLLVDPHGGTRPVPEPVETSIEKNVVPGEVTGSRGVVGSLGAVGAEVAPAVELLLLSFFDVVDFEEIGSGVRGREGERNRGRKETARKKKEKSSPSFSPKPKPAPRRASRSDRNPASWAWCSGS